MKVWAFNIFNVDSNADHSDGMPTSAYPTRERAIEASGVEASLFKQDYEVWIAEWDESECCIVYPIAVLP